MKVLLGLILAVSISSSANADSYDAIKVMDGITTRVVSSKGVSKVASLPSWVEQELARQTAANKKTHKAAKITKILKDTKIAKVKAKAITITQIETVSDVYEEAPVRTGYQPRIYHSQYYMPYSGHVSKPEAETDYREDFGDYVSYR